MQIRTFRALDMREALRAVKEELGPDAVILSTQQVKSATGAFGLFSRVLVEVTAAVDRQGATGRSGEQAGRTSAEQRRTGPLTQDAGGWPPERGRSDDRETANVNDDPSRSGERLMIGYPTICPIP